MKPGLIFVAAGLVGLVGLVSGCAPNGQVVNNGGGQYTYMRTINVRSGEPFKVEFYASLHPDCSPAGNFSLRRGKDPEHGSLSINGANDYPAYKASNERFKCNQRRVPGQTVYYRSVGGYIGADHFAYQWFLSNGSVEDIEVTVNVQ